MSYFVDGAVVPQFAALMVQLAAAWDIKLSEARIRTYAVELSDLPWAQLQAACASCRRESRFFPSIAEIRSKMIAAPEDMALIAWAALDKAARRVGSWSSIVIDDGAAAEAMITVFGSWPQFVQFDDGPGLALKRQEFLAAYRQAVRHRQTTQRQLPGLCEAQGEVAGHATVGRIHLDGRIGIEQTQLQVTDGHDRPALLEGRVVEDDQA